MAKPTYLLIDLGAVIYDIDYQKTIDAIFKLFGEDSKTFFSKKSQWEQVDLFEEGKISGDEFCNFLKTTFSQHNVENEKIIEAWNALLIGFRKPTVQFLKTLSLKMDLYLYSNTNTFHYTELSSRAGVDFMNGFHSCFKAVYLSHTFHHRKPHPKSFLELLKREGLNPKDGLFIDDTKHHIEGAKKAGLSAYHFKNDDKLEVIIPTLLESIQA